MTRRPGWGIRLESARRLLDALPTDLRANPIVAVSLDVVFGDRWR